MTNKIGKKIEIVESDNTTIEVTVGGGFWDDTSVLQVAPHDALELGHTLIEQAMDMLRRG